MLQTRQELLTLLSDIGIDYTNHEHPPVFTVEEAAQHQHGIVGPTARTCFSRTRKKICSWW
jgi:Ala-tRNA(Pro) deacylase